MTTLIDKSKRLGLKEMHGFVLARNQSILRLARHLGFSIGYEPGDPTTRVRRLDLLAERPPALVAEPPARRLPSVLSRSKSGLRGARAKAVAGSPR